MIDLFGNEIEEPTKKKIGRAVMHLYLFQLELLIILKLIGSQMIIMQQILLP